MKQIHQTYSDAVSVWYQCGTSVVLLKSMLKDTVILNYLQPSKKRIVLAQN